MTISATYDQPNAVVELTVTGLATAGAAIATIERSQDNVTWTPVRGAVNMPVTGNGPDVYLDYEFAAGPGVTNYYRVVAQDPIELVGVGSPSRVSGNGVDLQPSVVGVVGIQPGDVMVMIVALSGAGGGIQTPTINGGDPGGWTLVGQSPGYIGTDDSPARSAIYMKVYDLDHVTPTVVAGGGVAVDNAGVAQIATFRNVRPVMLGATRAPEADQPATTNQIEFPALNVVEDFAVAISYLLSSVLASGMTPTAGWTELGDWATDGTVDVSTGWQYQVLEAAGIVPSGVMVTASGTHNPVNKRGWTFALSYDSVNAPTTVLFTDDVDTPLAVVWLKDPLRPARNRVVEVASPSGVRYASRSGLFDIKGRAEPIEVSEIRRSRAWTQRWIVQSFEELDALLELFSTGRTLFLQVPARGTLPDCPPWPRSLPGGYISVGEVVEETAPDAPLPATLTAPVQTVAAPCADLAICEPVEDSP